MNTSTVLLATDTPTLKMFIPAFLSGAPMDFIHAVSTAFFLWFGAESMVDKIERIKTKYGLIER